MLPLFDEEDQKEQEKKNKEKKVNLEIASFGKIEKNGKVDLEKAVENAGEEDGEGEVEQKVRGFFDFGSKSDFKGFFGFVRLGVFYYLIESFD